MSDPVAASPGASTASSNLAVRGLVAFGRFWWDFLVGDTPELFLATLVVVGVAFLFEDVPVVGVVLTIGSVISFLALSTWRGRKKPVTEASSTK
jgi:hypothetical protein